jgi:Pyridoxamine 5'-phosphate oxidase
MLSSVQDVATGGHPMKIVGVDPQARVLSEDEVLALLREPIPMRLGMVDGHGWPVVTPVWHVFENGVFRIAVGGTSYKATLLRANPRAYFTVDTGSAYGEARGVRGRANVRVIDGDVNLAIDVARKALLKYTGTDKGSDADEMLKWARDGGMSVVELTPRRFGAFSY